MNKRINIPLFNQAFWIVDKKQAEDYVNAEQFVNGMWTACVFEGYRRRISICFLHKDIDESTIIHESVHLAHRILARVGIELDPYNDEVMAYLVPFVVNKILKELNKGSD